MTSSSRIYGKTRITAFFFSVVCAVLIFELKTSLSFSIPCKASMLRKVFLFLFFVVQLESKESRHNPSTHKEDAFIQSHNDITNSINNNTLDKESTNMEPCLSAFYFVGGFHHSGTTAMQHELLRRTGNIPQGRSPELWIPEENGVPSCPEPNSVFKHPTNLVEDVKKMISYRKIYPNVRLIFMWRDPPNALWSLTKRKFQVEFLDNLSATALIRRKGTEIYDSVTITDFLQNNTLTWCNLMSEWQQFKKKNLDFTIPITHFTSDTDVIMNWVMENITSIDQQQNEAQEEEYLPDSPDSSSSQKRLNSNNENNSQLESIHLHITEEQQRVRSREEFREQRHEQEQKNKKKKDNALASATIIINDTINTTTTSTTETSSMISIQENTFLLPNSTDHEHRREIQAHLPIYQYDENQYLKETSKEVAHHIKKVAVCPNCCK